MKQRVYCIQLEARQGTFPPVIRIRADEMEKDPDSDGYKFSRGGKQVGVVREAPAAWWIEKEDA